MSATDTPARPASRAGGAARRKRAAAARKRAVDPRKVAADRRYAIAAARDSGRGTFYDGFTADGEPRRVTVYCHPKRFVRFRCGARCGWTLKLPLGSFPPDPYARCPACLKRGTPAAQRAIRSGRALVVVEALLSR